MFHAMTQVSLRFANSEHLLSAFRANFGIIRSRKFKRISIQFTKQNASSKGVLGNGPRKVPNMVLKYQRAHKYPWERSTHQDSSTHLFIRPQIRRFDRKSRDFRLRPSSVCLKTSSRYHLMICRAVLPVETVNKALDLVNKFLIESRYLNPMTLMPMSREGVMLTGYDPINNHPDFR